MQLYSKPKTDEEYVEFVRKLMKRSNWTKWVALLLACGFVLVFWSIQRMIYSETSPISIFRTIDPGFRDGMRLGTFLGIFMAVVLCCAVNIAIGAIQYLHGDRTERLMLKFYDELKKKDK